MDWRGAVYVWKLTGPNYKRLIPAILAMLHAQVETEQTDRRRARGRMKPPREVHSAAKVTLWALSDGAARLGGRR